MRFHRLLPLAVLLALLLPGLAPAQERGKPDLLEVSPEDLRGANAAELVGQAHARYREGEFEDAAWSFIAALRQNPGDSTSLYNLACCFSLLGAESQALRFLQAAWDSGFRDLEHIRGDPDFDGIREGEPFQALLERLGEDSLRRAREAGKPLTIASRVLANVRVIVPDEAGEGERSRRLPLVIGLHGLGGEGERFAGLFQRNGIPRPFLYCAPQAPYPFLVTGRVGYSWTLRGEGVTTPASLRSRRLAEAYVLDVLQAVKREYLVDERKVFLLGFSQGASMAFGIGMRNPELFRGVIPIGGWLDPAEFPSSVVDRAKKRGLFLVCHSPDDRVVPYAASETAVEFLKSNGIRHRLVTYPGGHTIPEVVLQEITQWMGSPTAGEPPPTPAGLLLRYSFVPGRKSRYRRVTEVELASETFEMAQRQTDETTWEVRDAGEDGASVAITFDWVTLSTENPLTGKIEFDSRDPVAEAEEPVHPAFAAARAMIGNALTATITSLGEVREVSAVVEGILDLQKIRSQLQIFTGFLPEEPVRVGDRWERSFTAVSPTLGNFEVRAALTLLAVEEFEGARIARIGFKAPVRAGSEAQVKIRKGVMTGEIRLDLGRGEVIRNRTEMAVEFELENQVFSMELVTVTEREE